MFSKFFPLLAILICTSACMKELPPCEPIMKFNYSSEFLPEITAGNTDSSTIYSEVFDSTQALYKAFVILDSGNTSCGVRIKISDEFSGLGHIAVENASTEISFCVDTYLDSTFKKEYTQTWDTKKDFVTMYTSYNQQGSVLHEVKTKQYIKTFTSGELIGADETYAEAPLSIFERTNQTTLEGPVESNGIYVFNKEIIDLKTEHITYGEDFYIGFKHKTKTTLQTGYIHLEIKEEPSYNGTDVFFHLYDWGIRTD
jgi:hypothetical protein